MGILRHRIGQLLVSHSCPHGHSLSSLPFIIIYPQVGTSGILLINHYVKYNHRIYIEVALVHILTRKVIRFFLLLVPALLVHALFVAQAAKTVVTDAKEKVTSDHQAQDLPQVTDEKRPPHTTVPSGITLDSTLVQEINDNDTLLRHQTPKIEDELARLKQTGYLDRRTKRDIEGSLQEASSIMSQLRDALLSRVLGKWKARDLAQDLNNQGEVLDASLIEWQKTLDATGEGILATVSEGEKAPREIRQLIRTLSNISRMLRDTGAAIVRQAW